jgi:O-antigen/teichoic acid export membrane protein
MKNPTGSVRRSIKTAFTIGGASILNILISYLRTKAVALLIGPEGIGVVSLYGNLVSTASATVSMGTGISGTRLIADALSKGDAKSLLVVRRALFLTTLTFATVGAIFFWSMRDIIAFQVLGGIEHLTAVGWLAIVVGLSVFNTSQTALLQGMSRISEIAKISVQSSIIYTAFGVAIVWNLREKSLIAFVLAGPAITVFLNYLYCNRLPKLKTQFVKTKDLLTESKNLLTLGVPFMCAGAVGGGAQLWVRSEVNNHLGAEALGLFQSAWIISMNYVGLVLGAMATDYYPRLVKIINDHEEVNRLSNEQTYIVLLLSAPIFVAVIGLAPWLIEFLFSPQFVPAAQILRLQVIGDVFKVVTWPLGYIILARGDGKIFFFVEALVYSEICFFVSLLMDTCGLTSTGFGLLIAHAINLITVYIVVSRRVQFKWNIDVTKLFLATIAACLFAFVVSAKYRWGALASVIVSISFGVYSFNKVTRLTNTVFGLKGLKTKMKSACQFFKPRDKNI